MTHVLRARRLLTEEGWLDDHQLRIADGVIAAIEPIPAGVTERDAELLCPAYIDTHVHGGAGVDVMDDAPDVLDLLHRQLRDVAQRAFSDLLAFPEGLPEQDGGLGAPIRHDLNMHGHIYAIK